MGSTLVFFFCRVPSAELHCLCRAAEGSKALLALHSASPNAYYSTELNRPHRQRRCSERLRVQTCEPGGHLIRAAAGAAAAAAAATLPLFHSLLNLSMISSFCCNMRHLLRGSRRFKGMFVFFSFGVPHPSPPSPPVLFLTFFFMKRNHIR